MHFFGTKGPIKAMPPDQANLRSMCVLHTDGEICEIVSKVPRVLLSGRSAKPLVEFTDQSFNPKKHVLPRILTGCLGPSRPVARF